MVSIDLKKTINPFKKEF